ncbi:hypothetical protein SAMN02982994_0039 [Azospirillum lipoferum]|nr:hypothetical protein SAMN02982994_0039 [Azospirillum lipoferum]
MIFSWLKCLLPKSVKNRLPALLYTEAPKTVILPGAARYGIWPTVIKQPSDRDDQGKPEWAQ